MPRAACSTLTLRRGQPEEDSQDHDREDRALDERLDHVPGDVSAQFLDEVDRLRDGWRHVQGFTAACHRRPEMIARPEKVRERHPDDNCQHRVHERDPDHPRGASPADLRLHERVNHGKEQERGRERLDQADHDPAQLAEGGRPRADRRPHEAAEDHRREDSYDEWDFAQEREAGIHRGLISREAVRPLGRGGA